MALSQDNLVEYSKVNGCFTEKTYKRNFEYTDAILSQWDVEHGFTHRIFVGPLSETRPAVIKKTVAFVCVDENETGPVIEKWQIRHNWDRS